jgi:predicted phosphodiesterase
MRNLIITDLHGQSPQRAIKKEEGNFDRIMFLGDYGSPAVLREILALPHKKEVIIGNHDYAHVQGKMIGSYISEKETRLVAEWEKAKEEQKWALEKIIGRDYLFVEYLGARKIIYVHGLLAGVETIPELWGFLTSETYDPKTAAKENFTKMRNNNVWITVRGHDHVGSIWSFDEATGEITRSYDRWKKIEPHKRYIITVENFGSDGQQPLLGRYGIFDDKTLIYEAKNIFE